MLKSMGVSLCRSKQRCTAAKLWVEHSHPTHTHTLRVARAASVVLFMIFGSVRSFHLQLSEGVVPWKIQPCCYTLKGFSWLPTRIAWHTRYATNVLLFIQKNETTALLYCSSRSPMHFRHSGSTPSHRNIFLPLLGLDRFNDLHKKGLSEGNWEGRSFASIPPFLLAPFRVLHI